MLEATYNACEYVIFSTREGEAIYTAGNHRKDSQVFVDAAAGVGIAKMREYCLGTIQELSAERKEPYETPRYQHQAA